MGKYHRLRECIREIMKDGKVHTAEDLEMFCENSGIHLCGNRGPIYNVVYQLKQKGEIISDGENGYISCSIDYSNKDRLNLNEQLDLSDFEIVKPAMRKRKQQVISVFESGDIVINEALAKFLDVKEIEIRIKKDCGQLLLIPNGNEKIEIGKNNRFKNYNIYEKIKNTKIKLPAYYVGEWNESNEFWLGNLTANNPNKTTSRNMK